MSESLPQPDYTGLRSNVSDLGRILGDTVAAAEGDEFLALIERVRGLSKGAREGSAEDRAELLDQLRALDNDQLVPVARAFAQFLNLANIADQQHLVSRAMDPLLSASRNLNNSLGELRKEGVSVAEIEQAIAELKIE